MTGAETLLQTTTAGTTGAFTFTGVPLNLGSNTLRVRSTDVAGNTSTSEKTITRTEAPTVTAGANLNASTAAGTNTSVDLRKIFDTLARFETSEGNIDITLFEESAPATVANFLKYVNATTTNGGNYNNTIFHRLAAGFVLQGGGFSFNDTTKTFNPVTKDPAVVNEPGISNTRGTIAMAKVDGDPNSATDEFFFNLANNGGTPPNGLDFQNGGFTVFGKVSAAGLTVLDNISAKFNGFSGSGIPGAPPFPISKTANTTNFPANVSLADMVQLFRAVTLSNPLQFTFTATSNDTNTATVSVAGTSLVITGVKAGTTTITLKATDPLSGLSTTVTLNVTIS
jgi:cyclophilin family peptidyl-prolyl cis-trans isomerase